MRLVIIFNNVVNSQRKLSAVFGALADPKRRRILVTLSQHGEGPVSDLSKPFRVSAPAISRHLRVLESARLIGRRRDGRTHLIRFRPDGLKQAQDWMAHCAEGLNFSFDALAVLVEKEQAQKRAGKGKRK